MANIQPSPSSFPHTHDQDRQNHHFSQSQHESHPESTQADNGYYPSYHNPDQIDIGDDDQDYLPNSQGGDDFQADFGDMTGPGESAGEHQDGMAQYDENEGWDQTQQVYDGYREDWVGEGGDGYRGPTPESEHGAGALMLYNGPQRNGWDGGAANERQETFQVNQYAVQDGEELRRGLEVYPGVNVLDQVEETASPNREVGGLPNPHQTTQQVRNGNPNAPSGIATARAQGQFRPPQQAPMSDLDGNRPAATLNHPHVEVEQIGGRRILMKKTESKERGRSEEEEEEKAARENERTAAEEFDPTAPIVKFDTKKVLVAEWDKIQAEIGPFLRTYSETKVQAMFTEIFYVCNLFHQLNEDARKDLEEGVVKIEAEEKKQEECRKVIVDFSKQMQAVATVLSQFGGGGPALEVAIKEGGDVAAM